MNQQTNKSRPSFRWLTYLAGGYLLFMFFVLGAIIFVLKPYRTFPENSATPSPVVTPTPHILVHQPVNKDSILYENFSSNKHEWEIYYPYGKLEIINGKMILQTNIEKRYLIGRSSEFDLPEKTYYVQADFTTDVDKAYSYGLIFGFNYDLGTYYMFDISPKAGLYRLLKYNTGKWEELIPFTQTSLNPYPEVNTLSVYFDQGNIELYANGNLISNFSDDDFFRSAGVGVFVNDAGYRLIVDNFYAYAEK